ncbi:MAG: hypothetical protein FJ211_10170 [Ignavibacteria bacterium]|nr:hypothetical protein [Ignavibacteria bacterium]
MAVSGTKSFELDVAEYIEEAYERCGIEVRTGYDQRTARRSLNLVLADWANRGLLQWTIENQTITMISGTPTYNLAASDIDVIQSICRMPTGQGTSSQSDLTMDRVSREYYNNIPNKLTTGQPTQYYVDRQVIPVLYVWPTPDTNYSVVVTKLTRMDDAVAGVNTMDMPFRFYPCLAAGLAYYLAIKKAPDRVGLLKAVYDEEFIRASTEDRDRASLNITPGRSSYRVLM